MWLRVNIKHPNALKLFKIILFQDGTTALRFVNSVVRRMATLATPSGVPETSITYRNKRSN